MASPNAPEPDALRSALDALTYADAHARAVVAAITDLQAAFEAAGVLSTSLRAGSDAAAELRAMVALQIMQRDGISLGELARRLGVSKTRADQLIRAAKRAGSRSDGIDEHPPRSVVGSSV